MLEYYKTDNRREITTPSYEAVSKPIYKSAKGKWKNYKKYLEPYKERLEPYIKEFEYEL